MNNWNRVSQGVLAACAIGLLAGNALGGVKFDLQVSADGGVTWHDHVNAAEGSTVKVRGIVDRSSVAGSVGLNGFGYQLNIAGWNATNSTSIQTDTFIAGYANGGLRTDPYNGVSMRIKSVVTGGVNNFSIYNIAGNAWGGYLIASQAAPAKGGGNYPIDTSIVAKVIQFDLAVGTGHGRTLNIDAALQNLSGGSNMFFFSNPVTGLPPIKLRAETDGASVTLMPSPSTAALLLTLALGRRRRS
ncbi:MAG: hypothetical protein SFY96_14410 [Planctomycetota bacterium]|nr:hypothetical protein [Planctomycetota bacterium]